jgi:aspartyl-tRNA(Asn)/glutamyl-tRNA(Gln) amidotransferase subunit A
MSVLTGSGVDRRRFLAGAAAAASASLLPRVPVVYAAPSPVHLPPAGPVTGPLFDLEVWEAADLIRRKKLSPVELAEATLNRIAAVEPTINSFASLYPADEILAQARQAAKDIARGKYRGPLHGITVGVKDIYLTEGKVTEGNSDLYRGFVPSFDATAVARLKAAGAVLFGKTGTSELATATGWPARNPWDFNRAAGGSSTGSATGVAASEVMVGMGTCTGGSIRGPAANCGLTGFKPTYGTISLYGIFPLAWSMDHPGPLVHSARDAALVVDAVGGHDPLDPHTRPARRYQLAKRLFNAPRGKPLRGIRVGVPADGDYFLGVPNDDQLDAFAAAIGVLESKGASVRTVTTDVLLGGRLTSTSSFYDIIRSAEVGAYQYQNLLTQPQNMSAAYLSRVSAGVLMPGHAYMQAQRVRRLWRDTLFAVFDAVDVLIHPADNIAGRSGGPNPPAARPSSGSKTNVWNLSGAPAVAIPTGFDSLFNMPLSMQCVAAPGGDAEALLVADAFQQATDYHRARPSL